jgi:hypothetical protein
MRVPDECRPALAQWVDWEISGHDPVVSLAFAG